MNKIYLFISLMMSSLSIYGQASEVVESKKRDSVFTITNYLNDDTLKLLSVIKVEPSDDKLILSGYDYKEVFRKRTLQLAKGDVFAISKWSNFSQKVHWQVMPISLATVPFKIRPEVGEFKRTASAGITNLGANIDLFRYKRDRYFSNGHKSNHSFYAGVWFAPSVEELDSLHTNGFLSAKEKSNQLFISAALTLNYSYNGLTFSFVPVGIDYGTSAIGKEWVYNRRRWWGFAIGIEPEIFQTLVNK